MMKAEVEDLNSVEISNEDVERMRGAPPNDRYAKFLRKKEELRKLSKERAGRWPNTISAIREKRLADRRKELERQEEELCKQDAIDAANRAERRRQQIEKANKMLQIPHLTKARTKILMSSVVEEREAQIRYRKQMDNAWGKLEERWVAFQAQERENWRKEDEIESKKKSEAVQALKKGRLHQLDERNNQFKDKLMQKEKERQELRKQAQEDEAVAKMKDEAKRLKNLQARNDFIISNQEQTARKQADKERVKELEKKIAEYAAYRERVEENRKAARAAKAAENLRQREVMLGRLEKQLLEARQDSENRVTTQEQEAKIVEDKKLKEKEERARKDWELCHISRQQQIRLRKEQLAQEKEDDMDEAKEMRENIELVDEEVEAEQRAVRERRAAYAKKLLAAAEERVKREKGEKEEVQKEYQQAFEAMEKESEDIDALDYHS